MFFSLVVLVCCCALLGVVLELQDNQCPRVHSLLHYRLQLEGTSAAQNETVEMIMSSAEVGPGCRSSNVEIEDALSSTRHPGFRRRLSKGPSAFAAAAMYARFFFLK